MMNGDGTEQTESKAVAPPYIPYLTFKNFLQWLDTEGIPLRFDRSAWSKKYSGGTGAQLLTALRFLGLLSGEKPTRNLEHVVAAKGEDRKASLRAMFQSAYDKVGFEELPRATPGMLREWMTGYGIGGDTVRKAESFFINAVKDLDIPSSNALRRMARNRPQGGTRRATIRASKPAKGKPAAPSVVPKPMSSLSQQPPPAHGRAEAEASLMLWGLFKRLPAPGEVFSTKEREAWIEAARTLFNLEYKDSREE